VATLLTRQRVGGGGVWFQLITTDDKLTRLYFCKALRQTTDVVDARAHAETAATLFRTKLLKPELRSIVNGQAQGTPTASGLSSLFGLTHNSFKKET
jgi:hypothetical protein